MYIIYSETFDGNTPMRYFYGKFDDRNKANSIADRLNDISIDGQGTYYCVCTYDGACALGVNNIPNN